MLKNSWTIHPRSMCNVDLSCTSVKMLYVICFSSHSSRAPFLTTTFKTFTSNWAYRQVCPRVLKFVSWTCVSRGVPVYATSVIYELCFVVKCSGAWCFNFYVSGIWMCSLLVFHFLRYTDCFADWAPSRMEFWTKGSNLECGWDNWLLQPRERY